jgi:RNA polymerase sigma factor (TIGR02999 family)
VFNANPGEAPGSIEIVMSSDDDITALLVDWGNGDQSALDQLLPLVERELHRLAHSYMRRENPDHTLQTTALINETYLRLIDQRKVQWQNRAHFFGIAAQIMRRILLNYARDQNRQKRGGRAIHVSLSEAMIMPAEKDRELIALNDALTRLEELDPRKSRVVELRYFGGLSVEEAAEVLKIAPITVMRDWQFAKAWLARELQNGG